MKAITTQEAREAMASKGWIPLVQIRNAEHWVRGDHRVIITMIAGKYDHANYVNIYRARNGRVVAR